MQAVVDGVLVNYEFIKRSEEAIVFLHGWGGGIVSFKGAFNYFLNNSNYSLFNIDLPPFGKSQEPPKTFTIYNYYSLVLNLLKQINVSCVHLIGHSFGGRIAVIMTAKHEINVKTLTLVASAGIRPRKSLKTRFKIIKYKLQKKFVKNKEKLKNSGSRDYRALSSDMKKVFVNIVNENLSKYLKLITCPTIIFWAKDDKETPLYMAKKFNRKIKNSGLVLFENGGHFCYLKHHNKFVKALEYFLNN